MPRDQRRIQPRQARCAACRKPFQPRRPWARFCSPRCRQAAFLERKLAARAGALIVETAHRLAREIPR